MATAPDIRTAVSKAVDVVNANAGQTCVHLWFADDPARIDFVANAARVHGGSFEFRSGFETCAGSLDELSQIRAEVIRH